MAECYLDFGLFFDEAEEFLGRFPNSLRNPIETLTGHTRAAKEAVDLEKEKEMKSYLVPLTSISPDEPTRQFGASGG